MKFILLVCDPTNRTLSDFVHILSQDRIQGNVAKSKIRLEDFSNNDFDVFVEKAVRILNNNFEGHLRDENLEAVSKGLYALQLKQWLEYFSLDQFMIINGDELVRNPGEMLEEFQRRNHLSMCSVKKVN